MVSTRPARRASRPAQPTSLLPSWLSQHVSASEQLSRNHYWRPRTRPDPSTRTPTTWFRHDQLLRRRSAQPASLLPSWLSRVARNERSESKPSAEKTRDAVAMRSLWKRVIPSALADMRVTRSEATRRRGRVRPCSQGRDQGCGRIAGSSPGHPGSRMCRSGRGIVSPPRGGR